MLTSAGRIALCYVQPELRFAGAGKALLQGMEAKAREWKLPFVSVDSTITARDFYLRQRYLAGGMSKLKSGIQAISLWKYLDHGQACARPPCSCSLASRSGRQNA